MRSGDLNRRIAIQQRGAGALDDLNQATLTWATVATVWASIEPLTGRELMAAQGMQSEVSHKIMIRYQPQFAQPKLMATMRILYNARTFNIHSSMDEQEKHKTIEFLTSEGLNDG
jgi:SPP1 family predicted phage head-tail adaptor